jgi:riboflavin-specific deaminase-like protein
MPFIESTGHSDQSLWRRLLAIAACRDIAGPPDQAPDAASAMWRLYAPIATAGGAEPYVIGQLGQSLDGRIATATGHSFYINCPEAIAHLHRLRALVDAVIVGIGTVLADDPRLTVRDVEGAPPARIVIDPNGRLPPDARLLADDGVEVLVIQGCDRSRPPSVSVINLPAVDGWIAPAEIVAALAARGYRRILVEGGARTVSDFLAAGMLDRLHLCVAPVVIGSGPVGISLPPIAYMSEAIRPAAVIHRLGDDILFDCALERRPGPRFAPSGLELVEG